MPSQEFLLQFFHYNPRTGSLTWKRQKGRAKRGDIAGCENGNGYIKVNINQHAHLAHRLIWKLFYGDELPYPEWEIDHINHNRSDNRIVNLRKVTRVENNKNQSIRPDNKSGRIGVFYDKINRAWCARLQLHGKVHSLGYFQDKELAIAAREAAERVHGFHPNHGVIIH